MKKKRTVYSLTDLEESIGRFAIEQFAQQRHLCAASTLVIPKLKIKITLLLVRTCNFLYNHIHVEVYKYERIMQCWS